MERLFS